MSTIEQPPQDRQPVQTYVLEHDWGVIAEAIRRELDRGGQVYYLHNRVENIENAAGRLQELLSRRELIIQKRTKRKDLADVDIAPMILRTDWRAEKCALVGTVVVQAQNPGLNPQLLEKAVERYAPELTPDFTRVRRLELLDAEGKIFR